VKSDEVAFLAFLGVMIILIFAVITLDITEPQSTPRQEAYVEPLKTKYTEEAYTLEDGTLCTIVHGSSYAGIWSITCNYNKHRIGGES
jgi:hypothetical protein